MAIVIDGSDVGGPSGMFSPSLVASAARYFVLRGVETVVVVPWGERVEGVVVDGEEERRGMGDLFMRMVEEGEDEKEAVLEIAVEKGAYIVSNDEGYHHYSKKYQEKVCW